MGRPIRIAFKAVVIYVAVSLPVGIVMAELTLHPVQRRPPDTARIARNYAQYGAGLQPVALHAADDAEVRAWYSVPARDNGKAIILLHGIGDKSRQRRRLWPNVSAAGLSRAAARLACSW